MNKPFLTSIACVLLATLLVSPVVAGDWINAGGGGYETPANWSPAFVPVFPDSAIFDLDGDYTVSFGAFPANPSVLAVKRGRVRFEPQGASSVFFVITRRDVGMGASSATLEIGANLEYGGNSRVNIGPQGTLVLEEGCKVAGAPGGATAFFVQPGGRVEGTGDFSGRRLSNSGTVAPGGLFPSSLGYLTFGSGGILSGYDQTASGILEIDIVETEGHQADQIDAGLNTATLDGTLNVFLSGGMPRAGESFDIVTASAITGTFATVNLPVGMEIVYTPTAVQIRVIGYVDVSAPPVDDAGDGQGVAWGDFDNDGDLDIYLTKSSGQANRMFRNDAGVFVDATSGPLGDTSDGLGVTCGDYDNDGDLDIYVSNNGSPNRLLRNDGGFNFVNVASGPEGDAGNGHGASWVDYDNDGDLDLFLCLFTGPNRLLRNDAGLFVDVTSGPLGGATGTRNAVWGDYDNDGDQDVYVVRAGNNQLLRNEGGGVFVDATVGPLGDGGSGTGADWGDYDNDGDLDLYFANTGGQSSHLLRNNGGGSFSDVTNTALSNSASGFGDGVAWGDYDNDGDLDLYLTNFGSANKLFHNLNGFFFDATSGPEGDTGTAEGGPFGDYDNDGDLDLYIANLFTPNKLLRNDAITGNNWLQLDLIGVTSNRSAIGARVRVTADGTTRIREVSAASGQYSMPSLTVEFGLGSASSVDLLEIFWPSGTLQSFSSVAVNQRLVIPESFSLPTVSYVTPTVSRHDDGFQLDIFGTDLTPFPTLDVRLLGPGESSIVAYDIDVSGAPSMLRATFDLSSADLGSWTLRVTTDGGVGTFPKAVVVYEDGVTLSRATTTAINYAPALSHAGPSLGRLAFVSDRDGATRIYVKDPSALDNVPLVPIVDETGGAPEDPSFSRDGTKVVYSKAGRIHTVNWNGGDDTSITSGFADQHPAWSPVADVIVFSRPNGDAIPLFTMPAGGGPATQVTFPPGAGIVDRNPCWSPDGQSIAFVRSSILTGSAEIFKVAPTGDLSTLRQLTLGGGLNDNPSWSPDGRWIAFDSDRLGPALRFDVFAMDSRGDNFGVVRITEDNDGSAEPAWNATSTALAFTGHRSDDVFVATDLPTLVDTDGDLVPDRVDACHLEGVQLGRVDRDFDGCIDPASSFRTVRYWSADQMPVVYETDAAGDPRIADGSEFTALDQSFAAWTSVPGIGLATFTNGLHDGPSNAVSGDGRNTITFSDADGFIPGFLGFASITTVTADTIIGGRWYRPGEVVDADILFNAAHFSFSTPTFPGASGAFDLRSVATHEIGHVFGMAHSSVPTSTMFFALQRGNAFQTLEADDVALLNRTYGSNQPSLSGKVLRSDGVTPIPGAVVLAVGEATGDSLMTVTGIDGTYAFFDIAEDFRVYAQPLDGGPEVGGLVPAAVNPATASVAQADFLAEYWDGPAETNADPGAPGFVVIQTSQPVTDANILVNEDITPPSVSSVSPSDAATDVAATTTIAIKFDDRIDLLSVTASSFRLENATTTVGVAGNAGILQRDSLLVFTPADPLDYSTPYTLRVGPGIRDRFGNTMPGAFVTTFTTQAPPPLVLTSLSPSEVPAGGKLVIHGSGFDPNPSGNSVDFYFFVASKAGGAPRRVANFSVVPDAATPEKLFVTLPPGEFADIVQVQANAMTSNLLPITILEPRPVPVGNALPSVALGADVRSLALSPDGTFAYVATEAGVMAVDAKPTSPQFLATTPISVGGGSVGVVTLPDGARALVVGPAQPRLRAIDTNPANGTFHTQIGSSNLTEEPLGITVIPGGIEVLVAYADRVVLHAAASGNTFGTELRQWSRAGVGFGGALAVAAGGKEAYASTTDGRIAVLGMQPGEGIVSLFLAGTQPRGIGSLPAGGGFVAADGFGTVRRGADRGPILETTAVGGGMSGIAVSPEGSFAYAANFTLNRIDVIDLQGGNLQLAAQFDTGIDPRDVTTGSAGRYVYVITGAQDRLEVYDTQSTVVLESISPRSGSPGTIVTVNGSGFSSLLAENTIRFGAQSGIVPIQATPTKLVFVQPAGTGGFVQALVNGEASSTLPYRVTNRPDPGQFAVANILETTTSSIPDLVSSPTGNLVFGVHTNGTIEVMQSNASKPDFQRTIQVLTSGETGLCCPGPAVLTPDGKKLYVSDADPGFVQVFAVDEQSAAPLQLLGTVQSIFSFFARGLSATPDGGRVFGADTANDFVFGIDTTIDSVTTLNNSISGSLRDVAVHPNGKVAYVGVNNLGGTAAILRVLDIDPSSPTNGQVTASVTFDIANNFGRMAVRPDGLRVYASVYSTTAFPSNQFVCEVDTDPASPTYLTVLQSASLGTGSLPAGLLVNHGGTLLFVHNPNTGVNQAFVLKPAFQPTPFVGPASAGTTAGQAISLDDARLYVPESAEPTNEIHVVSLTPANAIAFQSGTSQVAVVGQALPAPLVARVTGSGSPAALLSGTPVVFSATTGNFGSPDGLGYAIVDANGLVQAHYTAGAAVAPDAVSAAIAGAQANATITVVADPATTPPQILSVKPDPTAAPGVTTLVGVDFSKPIDPGTVNAASFNVRRLPSGSTLAGVYTFAERGRRAVFTPSVPLDASAQYEVAVTSAVADANANPLTNPGTFTFATAAPPPVALRAIQPSAARAGDAVVLSGTGFGAVPADNQVLFGDLAAQVLRGDPAALTVIVPAGAQTGNVTVVVGAQTSNAVAFTVLLPATEPITQVRTNVTVPTSGQHIAIVADGSRAYMTSPGGNSVVPIQIAQEAAEPAIAVGVYPFGVAAAPGGKHVYVSNFFSNDVSVIDSDPQSSTFHEVIATIPVGENPAGIAANPNGKKLYVVNYGDSTFTIVDTDPNSATRYFAQATSNTGKTSQSVAVTPDGLRVLIGTNTGLLIFDAIEGGAQATSNTGKTSQSVAVTPDGAYGVVLATDGSLFLIDIRPGSPTENLAQATSNTGKTSQSVAVSPDGAFVYVTNSDGTVQAFQIVQLAGGGASAGPDGELAGVTLVPVATIQVGENPTGLAFDPSGSGLLLVVNSGSSNVSFISTEIEPPPPSTIEADLLILPRTIGRFWWSWFVFAWLEFPPDLDPHAVDASSVRMNDAVSPIPLPKIVYDLDHDGIDERLFIFWRPSVLAALPAGDAVPIEITGSIESQEFVARDTVRIIGPRVVAPAENEVVAGGTPTTIRWVSGADGPADHVGIDVSYDGGDTWAALTGNVPDTGEYLWNVPAASADDCKVQVTVYNGQQDVLEIGVSPAFSIQSPTGVQDDLPVRFAFRGARPNPFLGATALLFDLPEPRPVTFRIFSVDGRVVRQLAHRSPFQAGRHVLQWDGRNDAGERVGSGVYFVEIQAGAWQARRKVVRVR